MRKHLVRSVVLLVLAGCGGSPSDVVPPWLVGLIEEHASQPVANPPVQIVRQEYENGVFFYVPPRCCDVWSDLYDAEGALVCHPDGGITGRGDGQCPDLGELVREEVVWRDTRGPSAARSSGINSRADRP
jgi:hypothetical protein